MHAEQDSRGPVSAQNAGMIQTSARLLQLLGLLQTGRDWTAPALADRLEIDIRTVRRDITRLRQLGYPVHGRRGAQGGYRLGRNGNLPPLLLDAQEALAVAGGLRSAAVGSVEGAAEAADRALRKLDKVLPPAVRGQLSAMNSGLVTVAGGVAPVRIQDMTTILGACDARVLLRFAYRSGSGEPTVRDTEPHRLVQAGRRWYLVAWDRDRGDWRTFRVDRMAELSRSTFAFVPRQPDLDAAGLVSRAVSTAPYRYQARVIVQVGAERLGESVPATVGLVVPHAPDQCLLLTGSDSLFSTALHLASLGFPMRILEPPELVELLGQLGRRLVEAYEASMPALPAYPDRPSHTGLFRAAIGPSWGTVPMAAPFPAVPSASG